jgi:putative PIN family toxin of toxin-antitoxin system
MPNNTVRVVIDTNIWISFLIGKSLTGLSDAIINNRVKVLFSHDLFSELLEVLQRPKFKKYFSQDAIEKLIILLHEKIELVDIVNNFDDCRDKKDNFLLDLAISGKADYLITGDADLLVLNPFHGVEIISYTLFQNFILTNAKHV